MGKAAVCLGRTQAARSGPATVLGASHVAGSAPSAANWHGRNDIGQKTRVLFEATYIASARGEREERVWLRRDVSEESGWITMIALEADCHRFESCQSLQSRR